MPKQVLYIPTVPGEDGLLGPIPVPQPDILRQTILSYHVG
jgi:hypothetical protein